MSEIERLCKVIEEAYYTADYYIVHDAHEELTALVGKNQANFLVSRAYVRAIARRPAFIKERRQ